MRRRLFRRSSGDEEATINLTPLLDVVFVILIMFIVVAPLLETDQIALASSLPELSKESIAIGEKYPITIYVKSDDSIWFDKQLVNAEVLENLLKSARQTYPDTKPLVFHDRRAQFGTYQSVKNAVEAAGFSEMEILLQPG
jgi:biopolymer transport protein ExbD